MAETAKKYKRAEKGIYEQYPGSGVWSVRYMVDGRLVRKVIGKKKAAQDYYGSIKHHIRTGDIAVPKSAKKPAAVTVGELCDDYLELVKTRPDRFRDQLNPERRVAAIRAAFGDRPAASILPLEIDAWLSGVQRMSTKGNGKLEAKPLKPGTINRLKAHLSAVYQHGKLNSKVQHNPARDVKQRRMNNGVIRFLTPAEEKRLRTALSDHITTKSHLAQYQEPIVRHRICELDLALGTGMRKGEQYGLKWRDVDFDERVITLHDTKNGESRRVYMIDDVVTAMQTLRDLGLNRREGRRYPAPTDPVFAIGDNKKWWAQALKDAGIENLRWHDLRHTFCSRLAQAGVGLKVIQEAAGHKTIAMTARYAHMDQTSLRKAMSVLNRRAA